MNKTSLYILFGIASIIILFKLRSFDPKGILFGLALSAIGVLFLIISFALLTKNKSNPRINYFLAIGNWVNLYLTIHFITTQLNEHLLLTLWSVTYLAHFLGAMLSVYFMFKIIKSELDKIRFDH